MSLPFFLTALNSSKGRQTSLKFTSFSLRWKVNKLNTFFSSQMVIMMIIQLSVIFGAEKRCFLIFVEYLVDGLSYMGVRWQVILTIHWFLL